MTPAGSPGRKLVLIDATGLVYRAFFALPYFTTTDGRRLDGRVLNEGFDDLQVRTADHRVHLLRRAGDRVREVEAGVYAFVARDKEMIRRRGENIAAAEIDQAALACPAVAEAAAVGLPLLALLLAALGGVGWFAVHSGHQPPVAHTPAASPPTAPPMAPPAVPAPN